MKWNQWYVLQNSTFGRYNIIDFLDVNRKEYRVVLVDIIDFLDVIETAIQIATNIGSST